MKEGRENKGKRGKARDRNGERGARVRDKLSGGEGIGGGGGEEKMGRKKDGCMRVNVEEGEEKGAEREDEREGLGRERK